ncbi:hypothetical protein RND71_025719 [Anisodus tanguticus]|uniref:DUF4283 domain-containing protein n=1 Tax=Anisodus tanguticus TaxID=243964 RepID=A0AAE1RJJ8_9SOLA|nr:hypothetical protein RND71_025719 [Anisodus tanguticus]
MFGGNLLKLDRWKEQDGCVDTHFAGDTVIVNMVGLPIHLWSVELFKNVGELCGGFVDVICSMHDISRVKIKVRKGGKVPVSVKVVDGDSSYRIWMCIEFQPEFLMPEIEENVKLSSRRGGKGGGRGSRGAGEKGNRSPEVMERAVGTDKRLEHDKRFEIWRGRKNPSNGKRQPYPWISEPGRRCRLNQFTKPPGSNRQGNSDPIGCMLQRPENKALAPAGKQILMGTTSIGLDSSWEPDNRLSTAVSGLDK